MGYDSMRHKSKGQPQAEQKQACYAEEELPKCPQPLTLVK